jgi:hypothetical protein
MLAVESVLLRTDGDREEIDSNAKRVRECVLTLKGHFMRVKDNGERDGIGDAIARKFRREGAQVVLAPAAIEPRRRAPVA